MALLDGKWCDANDGNAFPMVDPANGAVLGSVPSTGIAQTRRAIAGGEALLPDDEHSISETRFRAIGRTNEGRGVFVVFTLRRRGAVTLLRPISARDMHSKEMAAYEKQNSDLQE